MKTNEGVFDRVARIFIGYMILSAFFLIDSDWRWLTLAGFAPVITGLWGYCPAYAPFGISTCRVKSA